MKETRLEAHYDALALTTMASGHLCLNLSERTSWEEFPAFADALLERIGGVTRAATDTVDLRLWEVLVDGSVMRLVFDDFPAMASLEANDSKGDEVLRRILAQLQ